MANTYTSNPILINTAMPEGWKAEVASSLGSPLMLKILKIEWYSPVAEGDTVNIQDPENGLDLLDFTCETAGQSQIVDFTARPLLWRDFNVYHISSGTIKIWYV